MHASSLGGRDGVAVGQLARRAVVGGLGAQEPAQVEQHATADDGGCRVLDARDEVAVARDDGSGRAAVPRHARDRRCGRGRPTAWSTAAAWRSRRRRRRGRAGSPACRPRHPCPCRASCAPGWCGGASPAAGRSCRTAARARSCAPRRTRVAARARAASSMKLRVPSRSSSPQRPQLRNASAASATCRSGSVRSSSSGRSVGVRRVPDAAAGVLIASPPRRPPARSARRAPRSRRPSRRRRAASGRARCRCRRGCP